MKCRFCGEMALRDEICFDCWSRVAGMEDDAARARLIVSLTAMQKAIEKGPAEWKERVARRLSYMTGQPKPASKLKVRGLK